MRPHQAQSKTVLHPLRGTKPNKDKDKGDGVRLQVLAPRPNPGDAGSSSTLGTSQLLFRCTLKCSLSPSSCFVKNALDLQDLLQLSEPAQSNSTVLSTVRGMNAVNLIRQQCPCG